NYKWDFGDGSAQVTTSTATTSHTYAAVGSQTVRTAKLWVQDSDGQWTPAGSFASLNITIKVNSAPTAVITTPGGRSGNAPLSVFFDGRGSTDSDGHLVTWAWDFGDGTTASGSTASHSYTAGTWTATLTVTDNTGLTNSTTVTVNANG